MSSLVQLSVRSFGDTRVEAHAVKTVSGGDTLFLCGRDRCPNWGGQTGLFRGAEVMGCRLTRSDPITLCQPFYTEAAEDLDQARRSVLSRLESDPEGLRRDLLQALDEAELFERRLAQLALEAGL